MNRRQFVMMAVAILLYSTGVKAQPQIIAHRGYHATTGAARNSLNALIEAQKAGYYGSECDVNMSADGELLVVHGPMHTSPDGLVSVDVNASTAAEVQAVPLISGERVATLDEYLAQAAKCRTTKLIIEIKNHPTPQLETEAVEKAVKAVARYDLEECVEYIAFRPWVCMELLRVAPEGTPISYLNGDYSPAYIAGLGLTGIDYNISTLRNNPHWVEEAHRLGLTVNVWTVNSEAELKESISMGVDFITTDHPQLAEKMIEAAPRWLNDGE